MLLVAFVIYVAAEIAAFVVVAQQIGVLLAVLLVLAISACGPLLIRRAGAGALAHARLRLSRGESPDRDLLDGVVIVLGGVLVCIPGFVGDVIGLALLIRPLRHLLIRLSGGALARYLGHSLVVRASQRSPRDGSVIDAPSRPKVRRNRTASEIEDPELPPRDG